MLRRILTLALLMAFGAPFVAPMFAATLDLEANLPACCRRHGRHHCDMRVRTPAATPAFQAPACPLYPTASQQTRTGDGFAATPVWRFTSLPQDQLSVVLRQCGAQMAAVFAYLTRGPPIRLA